MNIECDSETLDELEHAFKFNDAVLRHLIVKMERAGHDALADDEGREVEVAARPGGARKPPKPEASRPETGRPKPRPKPASPPQARRLTRRDWIAATG